MPLNDEERDDDNADNRRSEMENKANSTDRQSTLKWYSSSKDSIIFRDQDSVSFLHLPTILPNI